MLKLKIILIMKKKVEFLIIKFMIKYQSLLFKKEIRLLNRYNTINPKAI